MTNGEKIQTILDVDRDCIEVHGENGTMTFTVTQDFWNAEYKESTTKNDLGVDKTFYEQMVEYCNEHFLVLVEKDVWEDAKKALTTKNDLGVDAVSRDEVCRYVAEFVNHEFSTREEEELIDNIITGIEHLPSVTPQEPRCKECKWWKDSDGKYRRGCGTENQCPINTYAVYRGEGYCYRFSPKGYEEVEE